MKVVAFRSPHCSAASERIRRDSSVCSAPVGTGCEHVESMVLLAGRAAVRTVRVRDTGAGARPQSDEAIARPWAAPRGWVGALMGTGQAPGSGPVQLPGWGTC